MKICPSCQAVYEDKGKFCRICGRTLVLQAIPAPDVMARRLVFESQLAQYPENVGILADYGKYLVSVSLREEALVQFFKALHLEPQNEIIRREVIATYRAMGNLEGALTHLRLLAETRPRDLGLLEELFSVSLAAGKMAEASDLLGHMTALKPQEVNFLHRRLEILEKLGNDQEIIKVCHQLVALQPKDLPAWLNLAGRLWITGREPEAVTAFESVLTLDPDNPQANLYTGMARHDRGDFAQARKLIGKALSAELQLTGQESDLARLYRCSSMLQTGEADRQEIASELARVKLTNLNERQRNLAAQSYYRLGELQADRPEEAAAAFEASLRLRDDGGARRHLAVIHGARGDHLYASGKYGPALLEYEKGLQHQPRDLELQRKIKEAASKKRRCQFRTAGIAAAGLTVILVFAGFFYYGRGAFSIQVRPAARISVLSGSTVLATGDSDHLQTPLLRYGTYELRVEKEGYAPVKQDIVTGFGRATKEMHFELSPLYGSLKVSSEPAGAKIKVRNRYQEKNGTAPCEISGIFAVPSTIEAILPDFLPYKSQGNISANHVLDLGTIAFKGFLQVDSTPPDAEVLIDNVRQGATPFQAELPAKMTKVVVKKKDVGAYEAELKVEPGKKFDLGTISLQDLGVLRVKTKPDKARVIVNGQEIGLTPLIQNLKSGDYTVKIEMLGYTAFEKSGKIAAADFWDLGTVSLTELRPTLRQGTGPPSAPVGMPAEPPPPATVPEQPGLAFITPMPSPPTRALPEGGRGSQPSGDLQRVIAMFLDYVQNKNVNGAMSLFASGKLPMIKRHRIENVARDTEYYRLDKMTPLEGNDSRAKVLVHVYHKKFKSPEEYWEITFDMVKDQGAWKIWGTPGKRVK